MKIKIIKYETSKETYYQWSEFLLPWVWLMIDDEKYPSEEKLMESVKLMKVIKTSKTIKI